MRISDWSSDVYSSDLAGMNEVETGRDLKSAALRTELENTLELGRALGLSGTPSYVVGGQVLNGAVGYETLKAAIAKAREKQDGCKKRLSAARRVGKGCVSTWRSRWWTTQ